MPEKTCRWGILGTATIAVKNWLSIWNAENSTLVAVASRDKNRAERYIKECQTQVHFDPAPRACGSYEELLSSDDIDAVYIPLPTGIRKEWVVRAADAGKHVMCEKPCGVDPAEVEEMVAACEKAGVQFMDGVMFMHSARLDRLREVLDDGESIGKVKRITSQFSFCAPDEWIASNIRTSSQLEPLGCLGDLGWYNIRFTLFTMNWKMPQRVTGRVLTEKGRGDSPEPVPVEFSGEMFYPDGVSASFYCSFLTEHQQWASVSGTRGHLYVSDFVLPYLGNESSFEVHNAVMNTHGSHFNMERHTRRVAAAEYSNSMPNAQETKLFQRFAELALSGSPDSFWPEVALNTQKVMDACLKSSREGSAFVEMCE